MISLKSLYSLVILTLIFNSPNDAYDVAVYSATPAGIAAAISAAKLSPSASIVLLEPSLYIGGMSTVGGIGLRDLGLEATSK